MNYIMDLRTKHFSEIAKTTKEHRLAVKYHEDMAYQAGCNERYKSANMHWVAAHEHRKVVGTMFRRLSRIIDCIDRSNGGNAESAAANRQDRIDAFTDKDIMLRSLIDSGLGDGSVADAVRDQMDGLWFMMSDEERTICRSLSKSKAENASS